MKRVSLFLSATLLSMGIASAQVEMGLFDHVGLGISFGTEGVGIDVAAPIGPHFAIRAGYNFMAYTYDAKEMNFSTEFTELGQTYKADITVQPSLDLNNSSFSLLSDYYIKPNGCFHLTAGVFSGPTDLLDGTMTITDIKSNCPFLTDAQIRDKVFENMGGNNNIMIGISKNAVCPYIGFGYGRAIPQSRVGLGIEIGCQYVGNYKVNDPNNLLDNYADFNDVVEQIESVPIYSTIQLRISGWIF